MARSKKVQVSRWFPVVGILWSLGCGSVAEPEPTTRNEPLSAAPISAGAVGYNHTSAASRFHLGQFVANRSELGMEKVVGADGVFAINPKTGSARAILNSNSPVLAIPALTQDPAVHNAAVVDYFRTAGLPADQMGPPHVLTLMRAQGSLSDTTDVREFEAYTTVVSRVVKGIPVPDSFAAARFNAAGDTTMEWVYWPPIPQAVLDDAATLSAVLADSTQKAAFLARLPAVAASADPGQVTIRHSDFDDDRGFVAFAAYDVHIGRNRDGSGRSRTASFGLDGNEIVHPNRRASTAALAVPTPKGVPSP